jgi:hypothetical protein
MREPPKWYDANATDNPPWIKALAEVRHLASREGWRYQHVQAIIVAIDQYAEAALGNREFFLSRPYIVSAEECSALPASCNVTSERPSGSGIGSSKRLDLDISPCPSWPTGRAAGYPRLACHRPCRQTDPQCRKP